jgi:hypothetical protein
MQAAFGRDRTGECHVAFRQAHGDGFQCLPGFETADPPSRIRSRFLSHQAASSASDRNRGVRTGIRSLSFLGLLIDICTYPHHELDIRPCARFRPRLPGDVAPGKATPLASRSFPDSQHRQSSHRAIPGIGSLRMPRSYPPLIALKAQPVFRARAPRKTNKRTPSANANPIKMNLIRTAAALQTNPPPLPLNPLSKYLTISR